MLLAPAGEGGAAVGRSNINGFADHMPSAVTSDDGVPILAGGRRVAAGVGLGRRSSSRQILQHPGATNNTAELEAIKIGMQVAGGQPLILCAGE